MDVNCTFTRERLSDYLERALAPPEREAVVRHLSACAACDRALGELRDLVGALHGLDRVALPEGFAERFARRLAEEARLRPAGRPAVRPAAARPRRARWRERLTGFGWPAGALAGAAVAVILFVTVLRPGPGPAPTALQGPRATPVSAAAPQIGLGSDAELKIYFDAARDVGNVRFTLELPDGVRMVKDGQVVDSPMLTWEGELKAGRNLIPLRVRGVAKGDWTVTAKVEKGGTERARTVELKVNGA